MKNYESRLILLEIQTLNRLEKHSLVIKKTEECINSADESKIGLLRIVQIDSLLKTEQKVEAQILISETLKNAAILSSSEKLTLFFYYLQVLKNDDFDNVLLKIFNELKSTLGYKSDLDSVSAQILDLHSINGDSSVAYSQLISKIATLADGEKIKVVKHYLKEERLKFYRDMAEHWL